MGRDPYTNRGSQAPRIIKGVGSIGNVLIDWLTFSSKSDSTESLIQLLNMQGCEWRERGGRYYYQNAMVYGHVYIYYNGINEDMGVCLEMSGQGCRDFESFGGGDWNKLLEQIISEPDRNLTRIDIAYDDFERKLDLDAIVNDTFSGMFTSRLTHWNVQRGSRGCTVEHGLQSSRAYVRIYDKKAERKRDDIDYWVRCEIQLREKNAQGFAENLFKKVRKIDERTKMTYDEYQPKTPIQELYFKVINNYLRYVTPSNDSHKHRWPTAEHWTSFLENVEKQSVFIAPGVEYNIMRLSKYVFGQAGNAIKAYMDLCGAEAFFEELEQVKPSKNKKYDLLRDMYRQPERRTV